MATLVQADTVYSFTGTAADLLKQYPDSPYTAFVVTTQDQIECYAQHCARLSEGLSALVAVNGTDCCVAPDGKAPGQRVQHKVRSRVTRAVSACRATQTDQAHPIPIMVTAFIDNRLESRCSWEIVVHAAPFAQLSPAALVQVAVVAPPRWLPHVKHTNWVSSRQQYADLVPSSAAEGILGTQNGELLEGFISNLFIVQDSNHGLVVRTAVEGVLAGTKQQQVLAACNTLGINIKCEAPIQTERHLWKEAFLTNAVRGLRPISHISCPPNNAIGWEPWTCQLSVPSSQSVYCRVQRHLLSNCQCESV